MDENGTDSKTRERHKNIHKALPQNPLMAETQETHTANVSFLVGKFGKEIPVVDSFIFYPKDKDRVRFTCKTRGCNVTMTMIEGMRGPICGRVGGKHNHPNHERAIENIVHIHRLREECKDVRNKYIQTKTVVSSVRNESRTCRRKSTDYRLARRVRMHGQHPVNSEDIVVTPTLAKNSIFIGDDMSIIVLAREWGIRLLRNAERVCVDGTFRSAPVTHFQMLSFHVLCKNGSSFPVVHALLKDKCFASYAKVLDEIQRYATGLNLGPCLVGRH